MANLLSLRHVLKLPTHVLAKSNWNLNMSHYEAIDRDYMTSLASSYLIRAIDEVASTGFSEERVKVLKQEIKSLSRKKSSLDHKKRLQQLKKELQEMLFMPHYLNLVVETAKHYERANQGFVVNGIHYKRLLATSGGVKMNTIVYVNEIYHEALMERIHCGRDLTKTFVPAKLESYMGLVCSASNPVSNTHRVLVVDDVETRFFSDVIVLDDSEGDSPTMTHEPHREIINNASDGFGLIHPRFSSQWAEDLGLDYLPSGYTSRNAFMKGMLFTFDFEQFAHEVAGCYEVKDVWGVTHDIREIDIILTTSMLKLCDSYSSYSHYAACCDRYGYTFSVTKYTPKTLDHERNLNYQFIQSLKLSEVDIDTLIEPTVSEIKEVLGGDYRKALTYLKGIHLNEETVRLDGYDFVNALMLEPKLADDPYVRSSIHAMIKKRIDDAKIGVLKVNGNFQIVSGDPYLLCESVFGLETNGLLKSGEFYSNYWNELGIERVAAFRAPMICMNNIRIFDLKKTKEMKKWYRYMNNVVILNGWDTTCAALCGCDFD